MFVINHPITTSYSASTFAHQTLDFSHLHLWSADELTNHDLRVPDPWTNQETGKFYEALSKHGDSLDHLRPIFPERNRRSIQAKYRAELRFRPERVKMALRAHQMSERD